MSKTKKEMQRIWYEKNKDTEAYKEKARNRQAAYRERLREKGINPNKPYTEEQKIKKREYVKKRRAEAKEKGEVLPSDEWYKNNPEKHRERGRNWRKNNLERARELARKQAKKRRNTKWGKITNRFYGRMSIALKECSPWYSPNSKYTDALGYTWFDLYEHIEKQFKDGMSWDNWGDWHIDHIKPLRLFKYESIDDPLFKEAWSLNNLQPLWKKENLKKSGSYSE